MMMMMLISKKNFFFLMLSGASQIVQSNKKIKNTFHDHIVHNVLYSQSVLNYAMLGLINYYVVFFFTCSAGAKQY